MTNMDVNRKEFYQGYRREFENRRGSRRLYN